jgi:hypothetical protein
VDDLKIQLTRALSNNQLLESAKQGREFVGREFSGDLLAIRLENLYQTIGPANG